MAFGSYTWTFAIVLILGGLFYLGQIAIHNCVHCSMFRKRETNEWVGKLLCSMQLMQFDGWRVAHMLHHRFTNTERDPHCVDRPLIPYLLTHYYRITMAVWNPRRHLKAVVPPLALAGAFIVWQAIAGHGTRGLVWVVVYWLIPVTISQLLVAHFNYATHVGLPPDRGHNTRDFDGGIFTVINWITFGFYRHAQHHLKPSKAIPPAVDRSSS